MNSAMRWAIRFALFFVAVLAFTVGRPESASAQVTVPVDLCGVGVGVLGSTSADCGGPAATPPSSSSSPTATVSTDQGDTSDDSLVGGLVGDVTGDVDAVADVDASAPVDTCGVGVAVLGDTSADCSQSTPEATPTGEGAAPVMAEPTPAAPASDPATGTSDGSLVGDVGTVADVDANAPVGLCGVGVGVLGDTSADCTQSAPAVTPVDGGPVATTEPAPAPAADPDGSVVDDLIGGDVLGGDVLDGVVGDVDTTTGVDADAPVGVCGIGVGVLGDSTSDCVAGTSVVEAPAAGDPSDDPATDPIVPDLPAVPAIPDVPDLPAVPGVPSTIDDLLDRAIPIVTTGNRADGVISGLAGAGANLPLGSSSTGLESLLGSLRGSLSGTDVGDQLAVTGISTALLLWLQLALISGGALLRGLSKTFSLQ